MNVDENVTGDVVKRLRRAEGQIRGVIAMLEDGEDQTVNLERMEKLFLSLA